MRTLIKGGSLVSPSGVTKGDLLIENGKIKAAGTVGEREAEGAEVCDAAGCLVFPGFIDGHTHFEMPVAGTVTADSFATGTLAALCGGTTTIVDFATQDRGDTLEKALEVWHGRADGHCSCNYGFHMALTDWNERTRAEMEHMPEEGVTSFKVYLAYDALRLPDGAVYEILETARDIGGIVGFHCENGDLVNELVRENLAAGNTEPYWHAESRPEVCEAEAISRVCAIAEAANAPVNIVHVSTARGFGEGLRARARGVEVFMETCPQYLLLDRSLLAGEDFEGAKYVCSPPLRTARDRSALWGAVSGGQINTVSTDHCSFNFAGQKELGRGDFSRIFNGLSGVEHRSVLMYTYGVAAGKLTPERMCAALSENIARLYGMYPRKGTLEPGADADVVVWDGGWEGVITAAGQHMACDYTPYEGFEVKGRARAVFLGGELAARDGEPLREGLGRFVCREESQC